MKVLFDTNVYISEALVGGLAEQIIDACLDARYRIFTTAYILDETRRILMDKIGTSARLAGAATVRIERRSAQIKTPQSRHRVPSDPNDSPILKAAVAAGVDFLVTNDRHLLRLHPYEGIQIVSMRQFADQLRDDGIIAE